MKTIKVTCTHCDKPIQVPINILQGQLSKDRWATIPKEKRSELMKWVRRGNK